MYYVKLKNHFDLELAQAAAACYLEAAQTDMSGSFDAEDIPEAESLKLELAQAATLLPVKLTNNEMLTYYSALNLYSDIAEDLKQGMRSRLNLMINDLKNRIFGN